MHLMLVLGFVIVFLIGFFCGRAWTEIIEGKVVPLKTVVQIIFGLVVIILVIIALIFGRGN